MTPAKKTSISSTNSSTFIDTTPSSSIPVVPQHLVGKIKIVQSYTTIYKYFFFIIATPSNLGGLPLQFFGQMGTGQLTFASEHMGNEISVIRLIMLLLIAGVTSYLFSFVTVVIFWIR